MKVVFTGPAKYQGKAVNRADLSAAAVKAGFVIREKIEHDVDMLVASRADTQKAIQAVALGLEVTDFQSFCELLHDLGSPILESGEAPNPYVDINMDEHVPDFTQIDYGDLM